MAGCVSHYSVSGALVAGIWSNGLFEVETKNKCILLFYLDDPGPLVSLWLFSPNPFALRTLTSESPF